MKAACWTALLSWHWCLATVCKPLFPPLPVNTHIIEMVNTHCKFSFFSLSVFFCLSFSICTWYAFVYAPLCDTCIGGANPIKLSTTVCDLPSYSAAFTHLNSLHLSCQVGSAQAVNFFFLLFTQFPSIHVLNLGSRVSSLGRVFHDFPLHVKYSSWTPSIRAAPS